MSDATIRRATHGDEDALVALRVEMFCSMGVVGATEEWQTRAHPWFETRIDDPACGIFIIEVDGRVVASAMGAIRDAGPSPKVPEGGDVLINNVCVLPEERGRGYGRMAFDAVMEWAYSTGVGRIELFATADGRAMYERAGFATTSMPAMRLDR